jgi:hypothetical protein
MKNLDFSSVIRGKPVVAFQVKEVINLLITKERR